MNNKVAAAINILAAVAAVITGIPLPWWAAAILFADDATDDEYRSDFKGLWSAIRAALMQEQS